MSYLFDNNPVSNKQYGFIKVQSTYLQLLNIMDSWTSYLEYGEGRWMWCIQISKKPSIKYPQKISQSLKVMELAILLSNELEIFLKQESSELEYIITIQHGGT